MHSDTRATTRRRALALGGAVAGTGLAGCVGPVTGGGGSGPSRTDVPVILNWKPNPTQAGYFAARDRGYYDDAGLSVELVPGKGGSFATKQVGLGNYPVGLGGGVAVMQSRAEDLPVRSVAAAQQASNAALFTVREQFGGSLGSPADLEGRRIAVVSGSAKTKAYIESLLRAAGIRDTVELVNVGIEQQTSNLLAGNVDVATGIFSNALALNMEGYDASMLLLGNHVPTIGRTVFTRPSFAAAHPETVRAFLAATARGWVWASNNPEAAEELMIEAKPSLEESRRLGLTKIQFTAKHLILTEGVREHGWGWQSGDVWSAVHEGLVTGGVLPGEMSVAEAWTDDLRPETDVVRNYADHVSIDYDVSV